MAEMTFPGGLASLFNQRHKVGKDLAIDPDPDLHSYQDDFDHSKTTPEAPASEALATDAEDDEDSDLTDHDE